jgi:sporulation protein YlmC with PRC-barrel domain
MKKIVITCTAAALLIAGQALAAGQSSSSQSSGSTMGKSYGSQASSGSQMSGNHFGTNRLSQLMDMDVKSTSGEKLGDVSDVILDRNGNVSYLVISHGGILGMGDRLTPIPLSAFQKGSGDDLVVNIDKNRLDNAPHFSSNQWPNFEDRTWDQQVRGYYGSTGTGSGSMSGSGATGQGAGTSMGSGATGSGAGATVSPGRSPSGNTGTSSGAAQ